MTGIIMDGITYDVRVVYGSLTRSFALIEGTNAGTSLTNASIRDLVGTAYTYSLQVEPNPANVAAYDAFFAAISAPIDAHTVTFPYGQTVMTFRAKITGGADVYKGVLGGYERFANLALTFEPLEPQTEV